MRRVFVCGSLRKGESNHERFKGFGDNLVATGTISGVLLRSLGDYPALVPSPNVTDLVFGEVYEISDGLGEVIDRWEREAGYEVRTVRVTSSNGEVEAQAYFYSNPGSIARHPVVEGGDWALHKGHSR
jgi:gamma-glutamylcyclotransferase (GGCT)/AIG2-like uncharacterized protein YtfP